MEKANRSVAELQKTINEADVSDEQRETLDDVSQHIDKFQEDPQAHHQTLRERLEKALLEFDAEHHPVSEAMRTAVYDLSNAGV
jgi:type I site-specific restriction endonuclease